ncbi:MAG TPA: hypothetical protein VFO25_06905 [Candidatus Eremiobacteraceae bacterium]|nr:hypothetical protein [Candidatus Eremiobacteraceae bacterium]
MKRTQQIAIWGSLGGMIVAALIAGCGGGSTSAAPPPGGGGGHPSPSPSPAPSVTPVLTGNLNVAIGGAYPAPTEAAAANAQVDFTCGCTGQAGTGAADVNGNFTLLTVSTPVPASPNPTYTIVPGRNYVVIGTAAMGTNLKAQAYTMVFAGNDSSRNQYLIPGVNASDTYTAAVTMYVMAKSAATQTAFDDWNFFTLQSFYTHLQSTPTTQEQQLLTDIILQQEAGNTMYPAKPRWRPNKLKNQTIANDLAAITPGTDPSLPTPCPTPAPGQPTGCTSPYPTP